MAGRPGSIDKNLRTLIKKTVETTRDLLKMRDWDISVVITDMETLQEETGAKDITADEYVAFASVTWNQDDESAIINLCPPDILKEQELDVVELLVHEILHVRVQGHMTPLGDVNNERAVHALAPLITDVVKRHMKPPRKRKVTAK
jgi:phenylpyruvate tautomerase PptA (4-oxalocrotonate tautomerase family)